MENKNYLKYFFFLLVFLSIIDASITIYGLSTGFFGEHNPIVRFGIEKIGISAIFIFEILIISALYYLFKLAVDKTWKVMTWIVYSARLLFQLWALSLWTIYLFF